LVVLTAEPEWLIVIAAGEHRVVHSNGTGVDVPNGKSNIGNGKSRGGKKNSLRTIDALAVIITL
jgi:hypothetical protein